MHIHLNAPFSTEEIIQALYTLARHSCLGEDGISATFFLEYWDLMKDDLCRVFQEVFDTGQLPDAWGSGLIFLIPKIDDIRKWKAYYNSQYSLQTIGQDIKPPSTTMAIPAYSFLPNRFHQGTFNP